jgi:hypothetical protein
VGCTSREKQGGTNKADSRKTNQENLFTSQPLTALLGAAGRTGAAHVMTFGSIRIARDLDQALPNLEKGGQSMAERKRGGEAWEHN